MGTGARSKPDLASVRVYVCVCLVRVSFSPGRQPGNNKVLEFFGTEYERFQNATESLVDRFRNVIPEGTHQARIRCSKRETLDPRRVGQGALGDTLGDENTGLVLIDPASGHPLVFNEMEIMESVVASTNARIEVEVNDGRNGWTRTGAQLETQGEFSDQWRSDIAGGAKHILELGNVTISDEHYDS